MERIQLINKYKKLLSLLGMVTTLSLASGCSKEVECPIVEQHAHVYVDDNNGMKKYIISEKERIGYNLRTDDYILVSDDKAKEINRASKNSAMYDIEMNIDHFSYYLEDHSYIEYEYKEAVKLPKHPIRIVHRWTDNPNENRKYTGEERLVTIEYTFTVYKPVYTENGKVKFESEVIYNLNEIPDGYTYIYEFPRINETKIYDKEQIEEYKKEHNIKTK